MIYLLGVLLVVYFGWRFGGLFRAWRAAGFPADPNAARSVRFIVGVILTLALVTFFLWMAPRITAGLVLSMLGAAAVVIAMQFVRENLARGRAAESAMPLPTGADVSADDADPDQERVDRGSDVENDDLIGREDSRP
jgi:hypothetical protein